VDITSNFLVDSPSTERTLSQSDWLTVKSICGVVLRVNVVASKHRHSNDINDIVHIVCCQKIRFIVNQYGSVHLFLRAKAATAFSAF